MHSPNNSAPPSFGAVKRMVISTTITAAAKTSSFFRPMVSASAPDGTSSRKIAIAQTRLRKTKRSSVRPRSVKKIASTG